MRLPQPLLQSPFFSFSSIEELELAATSPQLLREIAEVRELRQKGLPPVTSAEMVALILGINPGLVWSFVNRTNRHYRRFTIPKGKGQRVIFAPKVALKVVQKWMGYHLSQAVTMPPHVFGFVPGRSHIDAAYEHRFAEWSYAVDIENFFGTTPFWVVSQALTKVGFSSGSAHLIAKLGCLHGCLTQGSPMSPVLSNLSFIPYDAVLANIAERYGARLTRYADDITFSGSGPFPVKLAGDVKAVFAGTPWKLADHKEEIGPKRGRIKVNGLMVGNGSVKLTKGYRNKLRAYHHILSSKHDVENHGVLQGHLNYAVHVDKRISNLPVTAHVNEFDYSNFVLPRQNVETEGAMRGPIIDRIRSIVFGSLVKDNEK